MAGSNNQFDKVNYWINLCTLALSTIMVCWFIVKYRFKYTDTSALVIIATYLFKNAMCVFVGEELYSFGDIITPIASTIIFAILLYFVMEMSYMRATLEEENL
jgi:hypothetical protein